MEYAVIMAGGSGKRLWPLSDRQKPKQLIRLFDDKSLLKKCVERVQGLFSVNNILIITNEEYIDIVHQDVPEIPEQNIIGEPLGRDTSNAIGLAATIISQKDPDSTMAVFSADQLIEPVDLLHKGIKEAQKFIDKHPDALVTLGVKATSPHTGYGYLKQGEPIEGFDNLYPVDEFKEKPNTNTARNYVRSGEYSWNSGMFVWKTKTILSQLERFLPHNFERLELIGRIWNTPDRNTIFYDEFSRLEKISIDYGVLERALNVHMVKVDINWQDVGSYESIAKRVGVRDEHSNTIVGQSLGSYIDSHNNIIINEVKDHLLASIHVNDMVIVHTKKATLICHRDEADRQLKDLINQLVQEDLGDYT
jgi:mannose-1-phosphate guanylyltransferase